MSQGFSTKCLFNLLWDIGSQTLFLGGWSMVVRDVVVPFGSD